MIYNIFIYCNPKSGSSTLLKTLTHYKYNIYYTHGLDFEKFQNRKINVYEIINNSAIICKQKFKLPIVIIDSYRTPIEKMISYFFHNIKFFFYNINNLTIQDLIDKFNISFNYLFNIIKKESLDEVLDYYKLNKNIKFDFNKGYHIWTHDNKIIVKLLFKNVDIWDNHLSTILQKNIKILPDNISDKRYFSQLYKDFKIHYKIPINNYNQLINIDSFKIYNSNNDKIEYYNKWKDKIIK